MTVSLKIKAAFSEAQVSDHTGAGAAYAALGSPTGQPIQSLIISTTLNASVFLSTDGSTDMLFVPQSASGMGSASGHIFQIDVSGNKQGTARLAFPVGTQFYLKQGPDGAPSAGDISITGIYGS